MRRNFGDGKEIKKCLQCNKEFEAFKCHKEKFCSRNCYYKNKKIIRIIKKCLNCGKEFEWNQREEQKFCSHECYLNTLSGEGNPFYGKKHSEKTIIQISRTQANNKINGKFSSSKKYKRGYFVSELSGNNEHYDSSYELERMKQLDEQGIYWTKKHGIFIKYIDLYGKLRHTVPDF